MPLPVHGEGNPPSPRRAYTAEDYWGLPEGARAELIDGELYDMAPPSWEHQRIVHGVATDLELYVRQHGGSCQVATAPVAVDLDADGATWVEPDVLVVCDPAKVTDRGVKGAPDLTVEVTSPSTANRDYLVKALRYQRAGVREYWIVDPAARQTVVYRFDDEGPQLAVYPFEQPISAGIFEGLAVTVADYL